MRHNILVLLWNDGAPPEILDHDDRDATLKACVLVMRMFKEATRTIEIGNKSGTVRILRTLAMQDAPLVICHLTLGESTTLFAVGGDVLTVFAPPLASQDHNPMNEV